METKLKPQAIKTTILKVSPSSSKTINNNTYTRVDYSIKDIDTDNGYSTSTYLYTIPFTGYYQIIAQVLMNGSAVATETRVEVYFNGAAGKLRSQHTTNTDWNTARLDGIIYLTAGTTVGIYLRQISGTNRTLWGDENFSWWQIIRIG